MTTYNRSPWIDSFPKSRVPSFPRHRGTIQTDVVIVGGGLTGCATAYAFAAAGIKVVVVDAGQTRAGQQRVIVRLDFRRSRGSVFRRLRTRSA